MVSFHFVFKSLFSYFRLSLEPFMLESSSSTFIPSLPDDVLTVKLMETVSTTGEKYRITYRDYYNSIIQNLKCVTSWGVIIFQTPKANTHWGYKKCSHPKANSQRLYKI